MTARVDMPIISGCFEYAWNCGQLFILAGSSWKKGYAHQKYGSLFLECVLDFNQEPGFFG
jgi:hypothetical protein